MFDYQDYLTRERSKHKSAVMKGKTYCLRCGMCCMQRPCIPTPKEFYKIAKFLKMSPKNTLEKYFVIDALAEGETKFIFPAKTTQLDITGKYISSNRTFDKGYCVFYDKKKKICKIYSVRPKMARITNCWDGKDGNSNESIKQWKDFDFSKLNIIFNDSRDDDWNDDL